jgi:hypothetical protein
MKDDTQDVAAGKVKAKKFKAFQAAHPDGRRKLRRKSAVQPRRELRGRSRLTFLRPREKLLLLLASRLLPPCL